MKITCFAAAFRYLKGKASYGFLSILFILSLQVSFAENYYWVAGSGNWSELNHWATSSGGAVFHSSVPAFDDNVIFDANSFFNADNIVNIDVESANCLSLSFTALTKNLNFTGSSELHIYSGLAMSTLVNFGFNGSLIFEAKNGTQSFITKDKVFPCNITFAGLNNNWTVTGILDCQKSLQINSHFSNFSCENLNIGGDLTISANYLTLHVNGSASVSYELFLLGAGADVNIAGKVTVWSAYLYAGNLELSDSLTAASDLYLSAGSINSNGKVISFSTCLLEPACTANLSNSKINIYNQFNISGTTSNLTSTNTSLYFSGGSNLLLKAAPPVNFNLVNFNNTGMVSCSNSTIQSLNFASNGTINGEGNNFTTTTFGKNGNIIGNHQFATLNLSPGYQYQFESGKTQTITGLLNATGNCQAFVILKSDIEGSQATISKATGTCNLDYLIVQDMNFTGGGSFLSTNFVDIQNTTGITGSTQPSRNLYWVGGSGNWSEASNWSTSSGGVGGACIPSPTDNVIFDGNSFNSNNQEVLIDEEQAFCNNINWASATNNPVFSNTHSNASLHIFGSCILNSAMSNAFDGKILFRSENTGNIILSNGNSFKADLYFEGNGGEWTLSDDLMVDNESIYLNKGTLISAGNQITINSLYSNIPTNNRALNISGSELHILGTWVVVSDLFSLNAADSHIYMDKTDATMQAGTHLSYNNISFAAVNSLSANIGGDQLAINQLHFASEGIFNCLSSTVQNLRFDGKGTLNNENNLIENAEFKLKGYFLYNNTFGMLTLNPGNIYTFKNNKTQTINTDLIANGNCNAPVTFVSDTEGSRAFIHKLNTDLVVDYIIMQDIEAVAGVNYTANNTTDLGNNPGWTINAVSSKDYYWVGGTGDWEDISHWSFSSGGIGGAVGACLPSQNDNVYFDELSFSANGQTVSVNIEKVACKSMDWSKIDDQVNFNNTISSELNVYGNMYLSGNLSWNFSGDIQFKGINNNFEVNTLTKTLAGNVTFSGENASWSLLSNFSTNKTLELKQGQLFANSHNISAISFISTTGTPSFFSADNATIYIQQNWTSSLDFSFQGNNTMLNFAASNSSFLNNSSNPVNFHIINMSGSLVSFLASNASVKKLTVKGGTANGTNSTIDSLFFEQSAQIKGDLTINYGNFKSITRISDKHQFGNMIFYGPVEIYSANIFETALFYHDATFYDNNTYDSLVFSPDHSYSLGANRTQSVNKYISFKGNSCFKIDIKSNPDGSSSFISLPSGIVEGYALNLKGIKVNGGASYYAAGPSSDLGGNTGWIFGNPPDYIYGFSPDSIYLDGQTATLSTERFNTDANTEFNWNNGSTLPSITTTIPGKFQVEVIYNSTPKQCNFIDATNIHFAAFKNADCGNNGEIIIKSDATQSYSYLWDNGSTSSTISNLAPGTFQVVVTDNSSGEKAQRSFNLTGPPVLAAEFSSVKRTSCIGSNDGTLDVSLAGGIPPYNLVWTDDNSISTLNRTNLAPGTYEVYITDFNGCQDTLIKTEITEPEAMSMDIVNVQNISCIGQNDASIGFSATGGTTPYLCQWSNGSTNEVINNLSAGEYSVIVTDANHCEDLYDTINIAEATKLNYSVVTRDQVCPDTKTGEIQLLVTGGTAPYTFNWEAPNKKTALLDSLLPGTYTVSFTDLYECETITESIEIKPGKAIEIENVEKYQPLCFNESNGMINIQSTGGYGMLQYGIDASPLQQENTFIGLKAGTYQVVIQDDSLCRQKLSIELGQPDKLAAIYTVNQPTYKVSTNGSIILEAVGGTFPYSYKWINANGEEIIDAKDIGAGKYILVLSDNNLCTFVDTVDLMALDYDTELVIPNAFSPNHDNLNDFFDVRSQTPLTFYSISIHSRWGIKLYQSNDIKQPWNGKFNGQICPPGVYYYHIQYQGKNGIEVKKGFFHLFK